MNKNTLRLFQKISEDTGLKFDEQSDALFGVKNGYTVVLKSVNSTYQCTLSVSVCKDGALPDNKTLKRAVKECKSLSGCVLQRYKANYTVRAGMTTRKSAENVEAALDYLTQFLRINGFTNCCQSCGAAGETNAYSIGGAAAVMCPSCFAATSNSVDLKHQIENQRNENVVGGIVGAFLGSLIGAAVIVILGQLGYVAVLSGIVIGVCTLKGYELLGRKLSNKGIAISVILILIMVYVGHRSDWAISIAQYPGWDVFSAFRAMPELIAGDYIDVASYYGNLALVYLFALIGVVPTVIGTVRNKKQANVTRNMSEMNIGDYKV